MKRTNPSAKHAGIALNTLVGFVERLEPTLKVDVDLVMKPTKRELRTARIVGNFLLTDLNLEQTVEDVLLKGNIVEQEYVLNAKKKESSQILSTTVTEFVFTATKSII
jgi:hypothetical protein